MSATVQRYMSFSKFASLIQNKSLFFSKMSAFEDALEGGLTVNDFFKVSNSPAIIDLAVNGLWAAASTHGEERVNRIKDAESAREKVSKRAFQTPFGIYPSDEAERLFPVCKEWLYVSCWHESDHECSAMWKLYGHENNSVCVFSTNEALEESIINHGSCDRLEVHRVNYISHIDESFSISPLGPFISKSKPYSFERETRVVSWSSCVDISKFSINKESGRLFAVDLEKMIKKIVVSPSADPWFKSVVEKLCEGAGINVDIEDSALRMQPIFDVYQAMGGYGKC